MAKTNVKKICMLAGGGDAPGMNACMEAIFSYASKLGWEVYVAVDGYNGLYHDNIVRADVGKCTEISHIAGCVYLCGRCPEYGNNEGTQVAIDNFRKHGFDALVAIGGNGTLQGLERFKRLSGECVIGVPATVDNDCYYTNNSLGFSTAVEAIVDYIDKLRPTMQTNQRHCLLQVMGKGCSDLALTAGVASFANFVDISSRRLTVPQMAGIINSQRERGAMSQLAIVEEHRADLDTFLPEMKAALPGQSVRFEQAYYYQRGTKPSCRDRFLAAHYGVMAVDLIAAGKGGVAVGMVEDKFVAVPLEKANAAQPKFNQANYDMIAKIAAK